MGTLRANSASSRKGFDQVQPRDGAHSKLRRVDWVTTRP
jgi:hypothetical protein